MKPAEWKDVSSYARGERGTREPSAWELALGPCTVRVHRLLGCGDLWFATCHDVRLENRQLRSRDVGAAKREALAVASARAGQMRRALEEASARQGLPRAAGAAPPGE